MNCVKKWFILLLLLSSLFVFAQEEFNNVTVIDSTFEDGTLDGWGPRGHSGEVETLEVVNNVKHSGSSSLYISNRTKTWQGPIHLLTDDIVPGDIYSLSAWVYFDEGGNNLPLTFSVERSFKDADREHSYMNVNSFQIPKGEWTQIEMEFSVGSDPDQKEIWVYFELPYKEDALVTAEDKVSFYMDDITFVKLDPALRPQAQMDIPNLYDNWVSWFDVGATVSADDVDFSSQTAQLLMKHFTSIVAGNAHKMAYIQPEEGEYSWDRADAIVEFGALTGMRQRWHTLLWHQQNPDWLFLDGQGNTASAELMDQRLEEYITTVMKRYKWDVDSWDVVNEVLNEDGSLRTGAQDSQWYAIMGPDYIEKAFRYARAASRGGQLVINDYNLVTNPEKRMGMYNLVKDLLEKDVPVDAIGMQMHINIYHPPVAEVEKTIELFASLGVQVIITELDLSIHRSPDEGKIEVTDAVLLQQAQRYKDLFELFKAQADKGNLDLVMIWGTNDKTSWLQNFPVIGRGDAPLLFDGRLQAKPAFWALTDPSQVEGIR